ncbi:MAG: hypothetical protein WCR51_12090 [Planctomycetia bacterium]
MNRLPYLVATFGACLVAGQGLIRADDALATAPREVAADGTVSVIVDPPATPPAAKANDATPAPDASGAATLLGTLLEPLAAATSGSLHDRPLPLLEALERSGDRTRRLWITQSYWKVAAAFSLLKQATAAVARLELVAPGAAEHDRAVLEALVAEARSERAEAEAALVAAQQELVDLVRLPVGEPLPWPVDRPLVTAYQTHFETIFAARAATGRVRAINRTLPVRHEALETRASAVRYAAEAFSLAEVEHAKGRLPIEAVAAAHERLVAQERAFIDDVRTYNNEIAEYVMAVGDFSVPDDRFASMLIGTPIPWRQQPVVITAGATADAPPPVTPTQPSVALPPPVFIPPAGLQAAPPAVPAVPSVAP